MRRPRWVWFPLIFIIVVGALAIGWRLYIDHKVYKLNLSSGARLSPMPEPKRGQRILICAPHEDDESLGCAGYIQKAIRAGAKVHVVLMTNGEYPEIDVVLFEETLRRRPAQFIRLGYMRQKETLAAMKYLGLPNGSVTFLGYPNQYLNQMWLPGHWLPSSPIRSARIRATRSPYSNSFTPQAFYCGQSMLDDVEAILTRQKPDIVITLHPNDVHVDHWPTGTVVRYALEELSAGGADFADRCLVYTYLIHRDQWPAPRGYKPKHDLVPPTELAKIRQTEWLTLPLSQQETMRKGRAIALYKTQGGTVDLLLRSFIRTNELFGVVPTREWPGGDTVPETEVIRDAVKDLDAAVSDPHADIRSVTFRVDEGTLTVQIETVANVDPKTMYHLSIHAGGASPDDRVIVEYSWQGTKALGQVVRFSSIYPLDPKSMRSVTTGNLAMLRTRWPLPGTNQTFFMVRAWTTKGSRRIDLTATEMFRTSAE